MIIGVGIDMTDIEKLREILLDPTSVFKQRHFTADEIAYCEGQKGHDAVHHFAGYYSAKEAFIKACGPGLKEWKWNLNFLDYEISTHELHGPALSLRGPAIDRLAPLGIRKIFLSITHESNTAIALVVLEA